MCDKCEFDEWVSVMGEMLLEERFLFAEETINDIYRWVYVNNHITDKQKKVINNIYRTKKGENLELFEDS